MLGIGLNDDAGHAVYLAGLHAAQALIFESTDKVRKRHPACSGSLPSWLRTSRAPQDDADAARERWRDVADQLRRRRRNSPADEAEPDVRRFCADSRHH